MEVHAHSHTARKKWTHYLWEFIMLFLAVFCGFLAENKREHMVENHRAKELVASLLTDLQRDTAQLNMLINSRKEKRLILDSLTVQLQEPLETIDRNTFYRLVVQASSYFKFSQSTGTISQLKNAGYLRYFSDNDLVKNIAGYEFWIQDYKSDEAIELEWINEKLQDFKAFNLDNDIQAAIIIENKYPGGTGVTFYSPDGLHHLKAIINELRKNNYFMLTIQAVRLKTIAQDLMKYLHEKYHLK
jgi:hypothetical protein